MWHVYVLQSGKNGRYYIGCTNDMARRLDRHNAGLVKATKYTRPWSVVYTEDYADGEAARKRERWLKVQESRAAIDVLIGLRSGG